MMTSTALDHASADLAWHHRKTARTVTAPPHRAAEGCAEPPTDEDRHTRNQSKRITPARTPNLDHDHELSGEKQLPRWIAVTPEAVANGVPRVAC
jgi:hypothetical protein